jgi:DNA helicase-2/ATP-dependent DNA helicase PcrA
MDSPILCGLNPQQQRAVECLEGPVLILAGAGSGKTKALTHRFAYLLREAGVSPFHILCVTFTNKAATEMRERIGQLLGARTDGAAYELPWLGTFHKVCGRILRRELNHANLPYSSRFVIYDESDQLTLVKRVLAELQLNPQQYPPRAILNQICGAKNELLSPEEYRQFALGGFQTVVAEAYRRYQAALIQANALDFDDILLVTLQLFASQPAILAAYQERFEYIMVDEYQDTNKAQYQLIKQLAAKRRNLFVIGDDWQSIYSWRGADYRIILDFHRDYPDAQIIKLEQNYRSTQTILDAAQAVITRNEDRSEKRLWTDGPAGVPVTVVECLNEKDEAEFIVREISALVRTGFAHGVHSFDDCVILYRTNSQSRALEEAFLRAAVPYRIVGGVQFYNRKEIKDILAYLRLLVNPADWVSLERVVNVPARGVGPKTLTELRALWPLPDSDDHPSVPKKAQAFLRLMDELRQETAGKPLRDILNRIIDKTRYRDHLLDGSVEGESRWENVRELLTAAESAAGVEEFLEEVALVQGTDEQGSQRAAGGLEGAVSLMTIHAAKGLEFPVVFMVGLEEGIFPHSRALTEKQEMEEERRLAYVGMTRAKERLYLLYAFERRLHGLIQCNPISRFIVEVPDSLKEKI